MDWNDKVLLVTGAAGAIGAATAENMAKKGVQLALVDYDMDALETLPEKLSLEEGRYVLIRADVTKEEDVKAYVDRTLSRFGRLDFFLNSAGIEGENTPITTYSAEMLDKVIAVNFKGFFYGLKYVLQALVRQGTGGSIVNMASQAGIKGMPETSAYVGTKHAVVGLTRTAAVENARHQIRVNAVAPGCVDSPMFRRLGDAIIRRQGKEVNAETRMETDSFGKTMVPLGRFCSPHEVADGIEFLFSDQAGYITGIVLPIDGGSTL